ncbi:unnamed protein product [Linum trigynum]|uniref:Uncharacterized protein n=1 Tax=Linum trigynum TaxID=586398 RepID=A0AAV2CVX4_9ROSI
MGGVGRRRDARNGVVAGAELQLTGRVEEQAAAPSADADGQGLGKAMAGSRWRWSLVRLQRAVEQVVGRIHGRGWGRNENTMKMGGKVLKSRKQDLSLVGKTRAGLEGGFSKHDPAFSYAKDTENPTSFF